MERCFHQFYPDLVHLLAGRAGGPRQELQQMFTRVLTHNLSQAVIGLLYGCVTGRV